MKKLLSFLGALGLTAVGAAGVVSCGTSEKVSEANVEVKTTDYKTFTISSKDPVTIDLTGKGAADVEKGNDVPADMLGNLVFANKDGKKIVLKKGEKISVTTKAVDKIAKDATSAKVNFSMEITSDEATELGLIKDNKAGKDVTIKLGSKDKDGNLDKAMFEFTLKAKYFVKSETPATPVATKVSSVEQADNVLTIKLDNAPKEAIKAENIKITTKADVNTDLIKTNAITKIDGGTTATIKVTLTTKLDAGDYIITVGSLPAFAFNIAA